MFQRYTIRKRYRASSGNSLDSFTLFFDGDSCCWDTGVSVALAKDTRHEMNVAVLYKQLDFYFSKHNLKPPFNIKI
jgi:hypothetical protein